MDLQVLQGMFVRLMDLRSGDLLRVFQGIDRGSWHAKNAMNFLIMKFHKAIIVPA
jgi:hypothetical protein